MCVLILSTTFSETFFILRRIERDMIKKTPSGLHVQYPLFDFSRQILEKFSNIKFKKIRLVGAELFHVDRRTDGWIDMTKLIVFLAILRTCLKTKFWKTQNSLISNRQNLGEVRRLTKENYPLSRR
jgi:hypothetical protein